MQTKYETMKEKNQKVKANDNKRKQSKIRLYYRFRKETEQNKIRSNKYNELEIE